ncbi:MAG: phosphodiesterase, partial [Desulfurococcaceae archaeon]
IVPQEEYWDLVMNITSLLRSYRDPDTGDYVFDIVLTRNESTYIGLGGARTGDVIVAVKPGYTTSTALVRDPATGKAVELAPAVPLTTVTGDHGPILPHHKELRAVFLAYGPGVTGGYLGSGSVLQVAPTVAKLLGISPPPFATQPPLFTLLEVTTTETETLTQTLTETTTWTVRETVTRVETYTKVYTETLTTTLERTITETMVRTATQTIREETTLTETMHVYEVNWGVTSAISVATLIVGLVIGALILKRV